MYEVLRDGIIFGVGAIQILLLLIGFSWVSNRILLWAGRR